MVDAKKSVSNENIVSTVIDDIFSEIKIKKINWKAVWKDAWDQVVDELHYYGVFIKDDTVPNYPDYLDKIADKKAEIKKLLLQIVNERL
jgi:hypothetical protein